MDREETVRRLKRDHFDILVIGGGSTGSGIALDAAARGLKVALVEMEDFGSGTSARSTKLIHGGVRYLEQAVMRLDREQFNLVRDALRERAALLRNAPHLAWPLPLIIPLYRPLHLPYYWFGLKIYDALAGKANIGTSRYLSPAADQIVAQAMAKDREERFAGAAELGEAVGSLVGDTSSQLIAERPITGVGKPPRRASLRHPWSWILAGLLLLGTVGGALAMGAAARGEAKPTPDTAPALVIATETAVPSSTPTVVPSRTPEPTVGNAGPIWAQMMQDAACRAGPGTVYEILGYVAAGQSALTYGTDLEGDWWWIQSPEGSRRCWISNLLVSFQGELPEVPILTPEPTPRELPATATEAPPPPAVPTATFTHVPPPPVATFTPTPDGTLEFPECGSPAPEICP